MVSKKNFSEGEKILFQGYILSIQIISFDHIMTSKGILHTKEPSIFRIGDAVSCMGVIGIIKSFSTYKVYVESGNSLYSFLPGHVKRVSSNEEAVGLLKQE